MVVAVSLFWLIELYWHFLDTVQLSSVGGPGEIVSVTVPETGVKKELASCFGPPLTKLTVIR